MFLDGFFRAKPKILTIEDFRQLKINSEPRLEMSSHSFMVPNKEWKGPTMQYSVPMVRLQGMGAVDH